jgi:hypothetical protein
MKTAGLIYFAGHQLHYGTKLSGWQTSYSKVVRGIKIEVVLHQAKKTWQGTLRQKGFILQGPPRKTPQGAANALFRKVHALEMALLGIHPTTYR